jgi:two-component system sensor histidine kinase HupT/HoxJ
LQALVNLVQNAIDASPDEGRVVVSMHAVETGMEVRVRDQGPGIPPEIQEEVFEAFFTTKGLEKGTGLGLYLARELVELCRGEIDLEPSEEGACLRLSLRAWSTP